MSATNDGGPAFPVPGEGSWDDPATCKIWQRFDGMSKREWFAGMALQGWLASFGPNDDCSSSATKAAIAKQSFQLADAMLAALAEKGGDQ